MPTPPPPRRTLSPERKAVFYVGIGVVAVGFVLFISVFFSAAMNFGNFDNFEERGRSQALRAVSGMVMMIVGVVVAAVSGAGIAGAKLAGGRSPADLIDEAVANRSTQSPPVPVVMVRCPYCKSLNDETDKVCKQCGGKLF